MYQYNIIFKTSEPYNIKTTVPPFFQVLKGGQAIIMHEGDQGWGCIRSFQEVAALHWQGKEAAAPMQAGPIFVYQYFALGRLRARIESQTTPQELLRQMAERSIVNLTSYTSDQGLTWDPAYGEIQFQEIGRIAFQENHVQAQAKREYTRPVDQSLSWNTVGAKKSTQPVEPESGAGVSPTDPLDTGAVEPSGGN